MRCALKRLFISMNWVTMQLMKLLNGESETPIIKQKSNQTTGMKIKANYLNNITIMFYCT